MNFWQWLTIVAAGGLVGTVVGGIVDLRLKREKTVLVVADISKFQAAIQQVAEAAARVGEQLGQTLIPAIRSMARVLGETLRGNPKLALWVAQERHGAGNRAADGAWLSDACATWVHTTCRPGLNCACRCHHD